MTRSTAAGWVAALVAMAAAAPAFAQTGTIQGTVTNAATFQPVAGRNVVFCRGTAGSPTCLSQTSDAQGAYSIVLPADTYYAYTSGPGPLVNQVYEGLSCPASFCGAQLAFAYGTPIPVASGQVIERSFRLQPESRVRGVVRDAATGAGLVAVTIRLFGTFQNEFSYISEATTDASGSYAVDGLTAGTYYATTYLAEGYVDEAFGDVWCLGQCSSQIARSGAPIVVGAGTETQGRDFLLARGGSIDGTITGVLSPGSATPVVGASVYVYSVVGDQLAGGWGGMTDAAGRYRITGLPGGTYYLQVQPPTENGLLGQFYGGSPCGDACDLRLPINGVPIQVATGVPTTGREVQVARGGSISGVVTNAATLLPVPNAFVNASALVGGQPRTFGYGYTDAAGAFSISALPPGTYSLWTDNRVGLIDQVYPDVACPGTCTPLLSQHLTVPVAQYATTTGRNFALDPGGSIMGLTTDGRTGAPTLSAYVNVYTRAAGEVVTVAQARPDASGIYTVPNLSVGTYWAMGFVFDRLRAQVFENIPCPDLACAPDFVATGTPIVVEPPTPYTGVNFNFQPDSLPPRAPTSLSAIASSFRVRLSWTPMASVPNLLATSWKPGSRRERLPSRCPRRHRFSKYREFRPGATSCGSEPGTHLASDRPRANSSSSSTAMAPAAPTPSRTSSRG